MWPSFFLALGHIVRKKPKYLNEETSWAGEPAIDSKNFIGQCTIYSTQVAINLTLCNQNIWDGSEDNTSHLDRGPEENFIKAFVKMF